MTNDEACAIEPGEYWLTWANGRGSVLAYVGLHYSSPWFAILERGVLRILHDWSEVLSVKRVDTPSLCIDPDCDDPDCPQLTPESEVCTYAYALDAARDPRDRRRAALAYAAAKLEETGEAGTTAAVRLLLGQISEEL